MKVIRKLPFFLFLVLTLTLLTVPFLPLAHATDVVNMSGLDVPQELNPVNTAQYFSQSFTTLGDGLNLSTIVLPFSKWFYGPPSGGGSASTPLAVITVSIYPVISAGEPNYATFPIVQGTTYAVGLTGYNSSGYGENCSVYLTETNIQWVQITVNPTILAGSTQYALVVQEAYTTYGQAGLYWWASNTYNALGAGQYCYQSDGTPSYTNPSNMTSSTGGAFGFELLETSSSYTGITLNAQLFLSLFLCVGMGLIGFGMTKGKEPLAAIFMMEFGALVCYVAGWLPSWILAASFAVLGIMLAYRFRGAISSHG